MQTIGTDGTVTVGTWARTWIRRKVLAWLGLEDAAALIAGQRRDHDALAQAIVQKADAEEKAARYLREVGTVAHSVHSRLTYYENVVVPIRGAFRTLRERHEREQRRAEAAAKLAAGPPVPDAPNAHARPDMSEDVAVGG